MSEYCIFCKIVKGLEPSWTVYEDELVKAFLDINPASEGHTLIIPKKHYENIYEIPEKELKRIIIVAKELAKLYKGLSLPTLLTFFMQAAKKLNKMFFTFTYTSFPDTREMN